MIKRSKKNNKLKGGKPFVGEFCREISTLPNNSEPVLSVAFHPSRNLLATGSSDSYGTSKLWRFNDDGSNPVWAANTRIVQTGYVLSVAFHPTSNLLATGSIDSYGPSNLWSFNDDGSNLVRTGTANVHRHTRGVKSVAFHPSRNLLAIGYWDWTAKLLSFNDDGSNLVIKGTTTTNVNRHTSVVTSVAFHPSRNLLATGSEDKTAKLWSFNDEGTNLVCKDTANVDGHTNSVTSVAFHPTSNLLATGSEDRTAKLWSFNDDGTNLVCISTLAGHTDYVTSVAFYPHGNFLLTGSRDTTAKLWSFRPDGSNPRCIETLTGHTGAVNSVAFNRNGNLLATGSGDKRAKLWDCSKLFTEYRRRLALTKGRLATQLIGKLTENPQLHGTWSKSTMRSVLNQAVGNVLEINTPASKANPDMMKAQKYLEFSSRESLQQGLPTTSLEDSYSQSVVEAARVTGFCAVDDTSCISLYDSIPWSQLNSIPGGCDEASELLEKLITLETLFKRSNSPQIDSKLRLTTLWIKKLRNKIDQCRR